MIEYAVRSSSPMQVLEDTYWGEIQPAPHLQEVKASVNHISLRAAGYVLAKTVPDILSGKLRGVELAEGTISLGAQVEADAINLAPGSVIIFDRERIRPLRRTTSTESHSDFFAPFETPRQMLSRSGRIRDGIFRFRQRLDSSINESGYQRRVGISVILDDSKLSTPNDIHALAVPQTPDSEIRPLIDFYPKSVLKNGMEIGVTYKHPFFNESVGMQFFKERLRSVEVLTPDIIANFI